MKMLIVLIMFTGTLFAECSGPKDQRVRVNSHFHDGGAVSELLFVSVVKERFNLIPHVCVAQPTDAAIYFVDIAGVSIGGQLFAVSIAWGPSYYVSHNVATFSDDSGQVRDIARLMVDDVAENLTSK